MQRLRLGEARLCMERGEPVNRIRFISEKRGFACFVRHVELPQLFGRIARRAGLRVGLTQGMSPHPHIVMGPALPVGVVSLYETAEIWFETTITPPEAVERLNANTPAGFSFLKGAHIPADTMSLNKCFDAAKYWLCTRDPSRLDGVESALKDAFAADILPDVERVPDGLELVMLDPSQNGPGALVKALIERELAAGWPDVCIARIGLGRWRANDRTVAPLL